MMKKLMHLGVCAAIAIMVPGAVSAQTDRPIATVTGGAVQGQTVEGSHLFKSIPYAAPPLETLRWKAPQPVIAWQGTRNAAPQPASCLQNLESWNKDGWLRGSEDCLYLGVRTASMTGKRPVIVWIHGGSNRSGSSYGAIESQMVKQGLVVVQLQYRLGVLGFLSHRGLAKEQGGSSGNYGLMDQIAALKWVKDNIAQFGGDPAQVTIFGESAGSQDVSLMLAAPEAQGLFRAAILQSGTPGFGMSYRSHEDALKLGDQLDKLADSWGDIGALRRLSPVALLDMQLKLQETESRGNDFIFLRTTIDGKVLPDAPERLIASHAPKPVIIGTDKIEFGPGPGQADLNEFSRYWFGDKAAAALAAYRAEEGKTDPRRGHLEIRMQSDAQFHCPANRLADVMVAKGWPVWRYEFDVGTNGGLTSHADEVGFVFDRKPVGGGAQMQDYWAGLALSANPNAPTPLNSDRPRWDRLSAKKPVTLVFGNDVTTQVKGQPRSTMCGWSAAY